MNKIYETVTNDPTCASLKSQKQRETEGGAEKVLKDMMTGISHI